MSKIKKHVDILIIGGGFFGCRIAIDLKSKQNDILILEQESELLTRASYVNQARVHNGYHYPRSILTAYRSRVNYPTFLKDYNSCIVDDFEHYYGVGRHMSKISLAQYFAFCQHVGLEVKPAPTKIKNLFNSNLIEGVFRVKECVFDAIKLKNILKDQLKKRLINYLLRTKVTKISQGENNSISVSCKKGKKTFIIHAKSVLNCTYSHINYINKNSNLPIIPLKHELTEMALVKVPLELKKIGVTVMCGPFFSFLPFPPKSLHCLSHVRYTPHTEWFDTKKSNYIDPYSVLDNTRLKSSFEYMIRDSSRYLPLLAESKYVKSLWEIKTVLPQSEWDDSRPILLAKDHGIENYTCIIGGKIDNVYDVLKELDV